jgi:hypothetical protein
MRSLLILTLLFLLLLLLLFSLPRSFGPPSVYGQEGGAMGTYYGGFQTMQFQTNVMTAPAFQPQQFVFYPDAAAETEQVGNDSENAN